MVHFMICDEYFCCRLKYAEQTIVSMYEELQVIRATQETEEELKKTATELCNAVKDIDLQVNKWVYICNIRSRIPE